jgi:type VII secretion protein EccE
MRTLRWQGPIRPTRIVIAQLALLTLALAALRHTALSWLLAVPVALALVVLGLLRWRHRWLHDWLATGLRYVLRPAPPPAGADPAALLAFVEPTAGTGVQPGVIEDADGVVAVLEVGDGDPLSGPALTLPSPAELLAGIGDGAARGTVQLIVSAAPAGGAGPAGTSYRQLTDGWIPARRRALLAVRLSRTDGSWSGDDLRRILAGAVRRIDRRLHQDRIGARALTPAATRAALAELAGSDPAGTARETWSGLRLGGLCQTSLWVPRVDRLPVEVTERLIARLPTLPAASTTIGLTASAAGTDLVVRVAAGTPALLATAVTAAYRLLSAAGSAPVQLAGRQRAGLAATLPLARPAGGDRPREAPGRVARAAAPGAPAPHAARVTLAPAGLMLGRNRHRQPVTLRLFRAEPTRAVLLGGVRAAQLLTLRCLALDARVTVATARPWAWEPFLRAVSLPTGVVTMQPPGSPAPPAPAGPLAPQLLVLDAGPAPVPTPPPAAWRASLVLREEVSAADAGELNRADLVILQPLPPDQAAVVGEALGLGTSREWLSRIRADMVGAVSRLDAGRSTVRWAALCATDIERQLVGAPERVTAG